MLQFLLITIAVLIAAGAILVLMLKVQKKSLDRTRANLVAYKTALDNARKDATRLQTALHKQVRIEEEAHEKRQELSKTADGELVDRANQLF